MSASPPLEGFRPLRSVASMSNISYYNHISPDPNAPTLNPDSLYFVPPLPPLPTPDQYRGGQLAQINPDMTQEQHHQQSLITAQSFEKRPPLTPKSLKRSVSGSKAISRYSHSHTSLKYPPSLSTGPSGPVPKISVPSISVLQATPNSPISATPTTPCFLDQNSPQLPSSPSVLPLNIKKKSSMSSLSIKSYSLGNNSSPSLPTTPVRPTFTTPKTLQNYASHHRKANNQHQDIPPVPAISTSDFAVLDTAADMSVNSPSLTNPSQNTKPKPKTIPSSYSTPNLAGYKNSLNSQNIPFYPEIPVDLLTSNVDHESHLLKTNSTYMVSQTDSFIPLDDDTFYKNTTNSSHNHPIDGTAFDSNLNDPQSTEDIFSSSSSLSSTASITTISKLTRDDETQKTLLIPQVTNTCKEGDNGKNTTDALLINSFDSSGATNGTSRIVKMSLVVDTTNGNTQLNRNDSGNKSVPHHVHDRSAKPDSSFPKQTAFNPTADSAKKSSNDRNPYNTNMSSLNFDSKGMNNKISSDFDAPNSYQNSHQQDPRTILIDFHSNIGNGSNNNNNNHTDNSQNQPGPTALHSNQTDPNNRSSYRLFDGQRVSSGTSTDSSSSRVSTTSINTPSLSMSSTTSFCSTPNIHSPTYTFNNINSSIISQYGLTNPFPGGTLSGYSSWSGPRGSPTTEEPGIQTQHRSRLTFSKMVKANEGVKHNDADRSKSSKKNRSVLENVQIDDDINNSNINSNTCSIPPNPGNSINNQSPIQKETLHVQGPSGNTNKPKKSDGPSVHRPVPCPPELNDDSPASFASYTPQSYDYAPSKRVLQDQWDFEPLVRPKPTTTASPSRSVSASASQQMPRKLSSSASVPCLREALSRPATLDPSADIFNTTSGSIPTEAPAFPLSPIMSYPQERNASPVSNSSSRHINPYPRRMSSFDQVLKHDPQLVITIPAKHISDHDVLDRLRLLTVSEEKFDEIVEFGFPIQLQFSDMLQLGYVPQKPLPPAELSYQNPLPMPGHNHRIRPSVSVPNFKQSTVTSSSNFEDLSHRDSSSPIRSINKKVSLELKRGPEPKIPKSGHRSRSTKSKFTKLAINTESGGAGNQQLSPISSPSSLDFHNSISGQFSDAEQVNSSHFIPHQQKPPLQYQHRQNHHEQHFSGEDRHKYQHYSDRSHGGNYHPGSPRNPSRKSGPKSPQTPSHQRFATNAPTGSSALSPSINLVHTNSNKSFDIQPNQFQPLPLNHPSSRDIAPVAREMTLKFTVTPPGMRVDEAILYGWIHKPGGLSTSLTNEGGPNEYTSFDDDDDRDNFDSVLSPVGTSSGLTHIQRRGATVAAGLIESVLAHKKVVSKNEGTLNERPSFSLSSSASAGIAVAPGVVVHEEKHNQGSSFNIPVGGFGKDSQASKKLGFKRFFDKLTFKKGAEKPSGTTIITSNDLE